MTPAAIQSHFIDHPLRLRFNIFLIAGGAPPPPALARRLRAALVPRALLPVSSLRHLRLRSTGEETQPVNRRLPILI